MKSETWLNSLSNNGYRLTGSRRAVVQIICSSSHAMTPLEIFDSARSSHPDLGLVTVYRTLEKLEELHLIQRVHQPSGCQAFIPAGAGHQHILLCQQCGKVIFFEGDDLESLFKGIAERTGYLIREHWLQLFGLCAACQGSAPQLQQ